MDRNFKTEEIVEGDNKLIILNSLKTYIKRPQPGGAMYYRRDTKIYFRRLQDNSLYLSFIANSIPIIVARCDRFIVIIKLQFLFNLLFTTTET